MEIMRCTVRRQLLDVDVPTLVALTYDYINVKATFSSEWAGMQKWLHVRNVEDQSIIAHVLFNNDEIGEDVGLNLSAGEWDVWIHGALYEDNTLIKRITTNVKKIRVEATGSEDEILPSIGPSVAEQAVAAAERAEAAADDAEDAAESTQGYANQAQGYAQAAATAAVDAENFASAANNYANAASNSADAAEGYADRAEEAVTKYPYIDADSKTWHVWNAGAQTWVDTGVVAEGATFTPSVDEYGTLSWTNNAGLPNPSPVNLVSLFDSVPELRARMDEILAEAEAGVADIEEQRDTILASIAAAAELGTDTTLTTAGMAADAKAAGKEIFSLENNIYINVNEESMWELGALSSSTGAETESTTRLRSSVLAADVLRITCADGYGYILFAYNGDSYAGTFNGSSFDTSAHWRTGDLILYGISNYSYRIVLAKTPAATMTTGDYVGINIYTTTDKTLTLSGKAADAKATGDAIAATGNAITALDEKLVINTTYDFTDEQKYSIFLPSTNAWRVSDVAKCSILKIPDNCISITVINNTGASVIAAFFSGQPYPSAGGTPEYSANHQGRISIATNTSAKYVRDGDMKFMYISRVNLSGVDITPQIVFECFRPAEPKDPMYVAFGASTTVGATYLFDESSYTDNNYPAIVAQALGYRAVNLGHGSTGFLKRASSPNNLNIMDAIYGADEYLQNASLVSIVFGYGNDGSAGSSGLPIGAWNDYYPYDEEGYHPQGTSGEATMLSKGCTLMGCLNWCIKWLNEKYPKTQLVLIFGAPSANKDREINLVRQDTEGAGVARYKLSYNDPYGVDATPNNAKLKQISEQLTHLKEVLNIPIIDTFFDVGIPFSVYSTKAQNSDGTYAIFSTTGTAASPVWNAHPNEDGYLMWGRYIAGLIASQVTK